MAELLQPLAEAVSPGILADAIESSKTLTRLRIPHALIGGLAVGIHGHPRATKYVDYLVGPEAFVRLTPVLQFREELGAIVRVGVIDFMPVPEKYLDLAEFLQIPAERDIPIIAPEGLILLKLDANRPQDRADVVALIRAGLDTDVVGKYLRLHAPALHDRFGELVHAAR